MKITLADKIIAWLALLSGLTISAVAIWYSVAGLVSIFAAAVIPIVVMGVVLEISKLIATVWLKLNWHRAPAFIRTYLLVSIGILMVITSMGIFGFLSKAHSDQSLVSGDVQAKIAVYDEKIKVAKDNIDANRKALKQLDEAVDQTMVRSTTETGADRAVNIRRAQQPERKRLLSEIQTEQKTIASLNEESAPIRAEVRKVEAEVGPIKYIAAFIYGDNADANVLEKAVTWVIIIIVSVFDPLAVILLLASQYSFQWFRKSNEDEELMHDTVPLYVADVGEKPTAEEIAAYEQDDGPLTDDQVEQVKKSVLEQHPYLNQPFAHFTDLQPMVYKPEVAVVKESVEEQPVNDLDELDKIDAELEADNEFVNVAWTDELQRWKKDNPNINIYEQQRKYDAGEIENLPWEIIEQFDEAAAEESKKKSSYMIKDQDQQVKKFKE